MSKRTIVLSLIAVIFLSPGFASNQSRVAAQENPVEGQYASINGLQMYYEIHGEADPEGVPLVLLHGGLGGIVEFSQLLPLLVENHQVIAVELQGHGHTADIDRPLSYELMADDVAALIQSLGYEKADVAGYSLGGGVALRTAIQHPEVVHKLVLISTPFQRKGIHDEFLAGMD
ncbi:MAG TPA: alpha/beta hydrolase, partial [Phototrophicaceae bacterium]|nr:alpha/beta hydrolase [Phototrophicaceae bacterium]